jgi:Spy/CpxP family protein refolding chaperone
MPAMGAGAAPAAGGMGMMGMMDKMMGMMDKMMGMGGGAMPPAAPMAGGAMPMMDDDMMEMAPMGGGGAMPPAPAAPMAGGGMGMMGMDKMEMAGMMGMGGGGMAAMPQSALPGFPGASHLYHLGATGFFLDHKTHIALTTEQTAALNQAKEKAALAKSTADRAIEQAEQELWTLTAADQPDIAAIEAKTAEIGKLSGTVRVDFIRAIGEASKLLTDVQRKILTGFAPPAPAMPAPAAPAAMAPMKDM